MPSASNTSVETSPCDAAAENLLASQAGMNRSTRRQWSMYASHRQHLERAILALNPRRSICVLGAGNCNDLDLRWLAQIFQQIDLVDLDAAALQAGVARQNQQSSNCFHLHAPVDLTGIADVLSAWRQSPPSDAQIDDCLKSLAQPLKLNLAPDRPRHGWDVVLSPCVLSQLLISVREAIGNHHQRYPALRTAMRRRHLRTIIQLLAPGGHGVLAIDVASTENFAGIAQIEEEQAPDLMRGLVRDGKCFRALAPAAMQAALAEASGISQIRTLPAWRWRLGLSKAFLVYGIVFRKCD